MAKKPIILLVEVEADDVEALDPHVLATAAEGLLRSEDDPADEFYFRNVTVYLNLPDLAEDASEGVVDLTAPWLIAELSDNIMRATHKAGVQVALVDWDAIYHEEEEVASDARASARLQVTALPASQARTKMLADLPLPDANEGPQAADR